VSATGASWIQLFPGMKAHLSAERSFGSAQGAFQHDECRHRRLSITLAEQITHSRTTAG
jgi:hypothetical protein